MSGFLLILFSELGDKTFFIALLLALKQSQGLVFVGTFGALGIMTVISVGGFSGVLHDVNRDLQILQHIAECRQAQEVPSAHSHSSPCVAGSSGPGAASD